MLKSIFINLFSVGNLVHPANGFVLPLEGHYKTMFKCFADVLSLAAMATEND